MKLLIAIVILALTAFLGGRLSFDRIRLPRSATYLILAGGEFLILGMLLGGSLLGLLDDATLARLNPFLGFALGWAGFLYGCQFSFRRLRSLPHGYLSVAMVQSVAAFIAILIPCFLVIRFFFEEDRRVSAIAAVVLAGAGSSTAQSALAIVKRHFTVRAGGIMDLLRCVAGVDAVVGTVAVGLAICAHSPGRLTPYEGWGFGPWLLVSLGLALLTVLIYTSMTLFRFTRQELFLIVIGILTLSSGLSLSLKLSPVFIGFLAGVMVANVSRSRERLIEILAGQERTVYILMLVVAGAFFEVRLALLPYLLATYLLARTAGKMLGGLAAFQAHPACGRVRLGFGLCSHGGISVALALNLLLVAPGPLSRAILSAVILAILLFEAIAPGLAVRALKAEGEIL